MKLSKTHAKIKIILPLFLVLALATVGLTYAYLKANTSNLRNTFTVGEITTVIEEDPSIDTTIHKNPSVKNTGKNDSIIRMRVTISPSKIEEFLVENNSINYDSKTWVYNKADGFWYYQGVVKPGKSTTPLFTEVKGLIKDGKIIEEFKDVNDFQITLYQEAVQATVWNEDGETLSALGKNNLYNQNKANEIWALYKGN